ncbi:hypothetical protein NHX12_008634 [Muraenolepis orangiensis]|uniref:YqaJ viral recombinase domain-containing protein n=1 Tax=Muraenolepis orangiensis TaxID=630683 RepID=A0A9Q0DL47_9TELE|nr:hypothetical protein NHX12_008634 [Muraenolepis orangiensis]
MEPTKTPVQNWTKKPADSERSERGGTKPDQKPDQKPAKKPAQMPGQKPAQKLDQKPAQKPDQKPAKKPAKKPAQMPGQKPAQMPGQKPAQMPGQKPAQKSEVEGGNAQDIILGLEGEELESSIVEEIEVLTRGQRENPAWFDYRKNRITASNVHNIAHCRFVARKSSTPPASYLADITGHKGERVQTRAMTWGVDNEAPAVKLYEVLKSQRLGREVFVQDSGLFIDHKRPWLGASPDGIVTDKLSGQQLLCLEVKCPFKHKDRTVEEACREDPAFCLQIQSEEELHGQRPVYQLKQKHSYYSQIQCQLAVTGMKQADLVVFTLKETALVPVTFNPEFWEQTLTKLQIFYEEVLLPIHKKLRQPDPAARPEM